VQAENRSSPIDAPTHQVASLRPLGQIRWLVEPEADVLDRSLGLLSALTDSSEGAAGRVTPLGWELERTEPAERVFFQRNGLQDLRVACFAPSLSLTRREGLRFFPTPVEWHLHWSGRAEELGLPGPKTVGAGVITTPRPLLGAPRSFLMTLWPSEARTVHQWLRAGRLPDDDRTEIASAILGVARSCHWHGIAGLDFDTHTLLVDPRKRRVLMPDLHALRATGPVLGASRASADRRAVDRLCRKILAGTRVGVADLDKRAA